MSQKVFVIINTDLGWDNICHIFDNQKAVDDFKKDHTDRSYHVITHTLEKEYEPE